MARITIPGFSGVVRITAPQRLEDHQAQVAVDCDFRSGDLRPYYGDKQSETFGGTYTPADPASLFLYDQGKLVVEPGDLSFARSPVFYADSQGNDERMFFADNASDTAYPMQVEEITTSGRIPSSALRLGVPKPADLNENAIDREEQSGTIAVLRAETNGDGYVTIPRTEIEAANLKKGDKLLVEAPGYVLGSTYRIKSLQLYGTEETATHYQIIFENDKRKWKLGTIYLTKNETTVQFALGGHGFQADDLVFFSHNKQTTGSMILPTGHNLPSGNMSRPFRVVNATYDRFELQFYDNGWTTFALNTPWAFSTGDFTNAGETIHKKVALLASYTLPFPDESLPVVALSAPGAPADPSFTGVAQSQYDSDSIEAKWYNAATADLVADRAYCVTFVNQYGDESEPSLPTDTMTVVPGSPVTFGAFSISKDTEGVYTGTPTVERYPLPTEIRLYRTDATGTFRLVTTDSGTSGSNKINWSTADTADPIYVDTLLDSELGEPLATAGWSVPVIGMRGLTNCPNGIVAGHRGRTIFGSVPYAPYAWPIANQVATDYDVVGLVPTSAGLVVVTKGMPAILIGDNPETWSMQKLEYPQGCVARRSIVDMGEFAMYASPDGLVAIAGANVEILTKTIMTREQWQEYNPETLIAAQVEGRYIASYESGGTRKGFIYDPQTQSFTDLTLAASAFCNDLLDDVLLMLNPDGKIYEWNQDTTTFKPYTWHSKWFQLPVPEIMGVAQIFTTTIDLTGRSLTFRLHGYDNNQSVLIYEISTASSPDAILGNRPFRLPYVAPGRFTAFKVTLEGSIPVGMVMLGRVMDELKESP